MTNTIQFVQSFDVARMHVFPVLRSILIPRLFFIVGWDIHARHESSHMHKMALGEKLVAE